MKIIRDLVHEYIRVDKFIERLINTLHFQRLRDINQLTAYHVFPSATHNRFEHSLGVMYLSHKAFCGLKKYLVNNREDEQIYHKLLSHLTVASLLHDIGHAPFSHLGEKYYRPYEIISKINNLIDKQNLKINKKIFKVDIAKHELMSCYIILKKYIIFLPGFDLELICRCITGQLYPNVDTNWKENIIIQLLSSDTIDADKLDYLLRDIFMTGLSAPSIDISRLFRSIMIHPTTKKIIYCNQATNVIQNIIDSRDTLYLLVLNHHTTVYTDFILEFYIKHLIINFERRNQKKYADELNPEDFFSCEAICNNLVSDSDLWIQLKAPLFLEDDKISNYTREILPQLFSREFLKPLWKTIYTFNLFLGENIKSSSMRRELVEKLCYKDDYSYRAYVATCLIKECNLKHGQVFIVPRSNKFYSLNPDNVFSVCLGDKEEDIKKLLPQRDYAELNYKDVSFYVFCPETMINNIMGNFIKLANKPLPYIAEKDKTPHKTIWLEDDKKNNYT